MARNTAAGAADGRAVRVRDADFTADFASIRHVRSTVFIDCSTLTRMGKKTTKMVTISFGQAL